MMSCKMNSNREYIHGYCSPCKRFFNSFFSLSSIKLQQTSAGKKPAPPPNYNKPNHQTQHHHQTSQPSTKKIPKSTETPNIPNRYNLAQRQPHRPTENPSEKPIWKIQQKPTWKTQRKTRWICPDLPLICRRFAAVDRSCGLVELWIDTCDQSCDRSCDDVDWFVTEREKDEYREIDREGETGYGEIEEREKEIRKYDREIERKSV